MAQVCSDVVDLFDGPGVDSVEDSGTQRTGMLIRDEDTRAHAADPDSHHADVFRRCQFTGDFRKFLPPEGRVHFHLPGGRPGDIVVSNCRGMDLAAETYQDAFAAGGADIDAEDNLPHHVPMLRTPRGLPRTRAVTALMTLWRYARWA
jgi:hypothetical protein